MPPAGRCTHDFAGTLDRLALPDQTVGAEEHDTDLAGLEVHAHALDAEANLERSDLRTWSLEWQGGGQGLHVLDKLLGLDVGHAVHTGDTITARS